MPNFDQIKTKTKVTAQKFNIMTKWLMTKTKIKAKKKKYNKN